MTQEELAEKLDVSLDAVSKYERSLSYIRGDLEHRLTENLGWSADEVIACREDWETGRTRQSGPTYRLLNERDALAEFGASVTARNRAIAAMETGDLDSMPDGFSASDSIWIDIATEGVLSGSYVMFGAELVGHVGLIFLGPALERRFRDCRLEEGELSTDLLKRPILPGEYFGYCPAVYIARGHEAAGLLLLSGFVGILEDLAEREVFVREIGAISISKLGRQLCEDLGLRFHGEHRRYSGFGVWTLPGEKFASSILGRRSAKLRTSYESQGWSD